MNSSEATQDPEGVALQERARLVLEAHGLCVAVATQLFIERIAATGRVPGWLSRKPTQTTRTAVSQVRAGRTRRITLEQLMTVE